METSSTAHTTASQPPLTILIPGKIREKNDPADSTETLTIEKTYEIVAGTRGEALVATSVTLTEDQIVEFQFDDGDPADPTRKTTVWLGDFPLSTSCSLAPPRRFGVPKQTARQWLIFRSKWWLAIRTAAESFRKQS